MNTFERAFELLMLYEGGYVNDPHDPGGETKYGISKRSYPNEDIAGMTLDRAKDIYYGEWWLALHGFDLPAPVAILLFDAAVNTGKGKAVQCLQQALNVKVDGILGPVTKAAAREQYGRALLCEFTARRVMYYASLEQFSRYGLGWTRRAIGTFNAVLEMK